MKPYPLVLSLLATAGVVALLIQHRAIQALRQEVAEIRGEMQRNVAAERKAESPQVVSAVVLTPEAAPGIPSETERGELAKLRDELTALKKDTAVLNRLAQAAQARAAEATVPTKLVPAGEWKNAGYDSPAAATETVLWAAVAGEIGTLAESIAMTPSAREKADALFAGLPEQTRAEYGTSEKLVALMLAKDAGNVSGMQVLGQRELSPDNVGMRVRFGNEEGKTKDETFVLHRSSTGWKLVIPDAPIEKWARQLRGGK